MLYLLYFAAMALVVPIALVIGIVKGLREAKARKAKAVPEPAPIDIAETIAGWGRPSCAGPDDVVVETVIGGSVPSDIGEADVDVACRWVEENLPQATGIVDVELAGYDRDGRALYRVIYEMEAPA